MLALAVRDRARSDDDARAHVGLLLPRYLGVGEIEADQLAVADEERHRMGARASPARATR